MTGACRETPHRRNLPELGGAPKSVAAPENSFARLIT
jgi:hypothetical protein